MLSTEEESAELHLVDAAFQYVKDSRYPVKCRKTRKRAIGKNAAMFVFSDGVIFIEKKKKGRASMIIGMIGYLIIIQSHISLHRAKILSDPRRADQNSSSLPHGDKLWPFWSEKHGVKDYRKVLVERNC